MAAGTLRGPAVFLFLAAGLVCVFNGVVDVVFLAP
jgi:hypothetical protein